MAAERELSGWSLAVDEKTDKELGQDQNKPDQTRSAKIKSNKLSFKLIRSR